MERADGVKFPAVRETETSAAGSEEAWLRSPPLLSGPFRLRQALSPPRFLLEPVRSLFPGEGIKSRAVVSLWPMI